MDSPNGSAANQSRLERLRGEQISTLYRNAPLGMGATLIAGVLLEQFLLSTGGVSVRAMHIWVGVLTVQTLVRLALCEVYRRRNPPARDWRGWAAVFSVGTLAGGLTWGVGSLWMMVPGHFDYQLLVVVMILALVYGSVSAFGIYLPAFCALTIPALLPVTIWGALQPDTAHRVFAALSALWMPVIVMLAWRHNRMATESLDLRYENLDLLKDLERQRDRAEEANIAKSQFLASASHDLRQPVHALGMFVGALRAHDMPVPARRLLGHIESSVSALDGLFSALLDISRLDAGVVQANVSVFALQPLLERICRDHEAEAAQKGLVLTLMPCTAVIRSDTVLLERVLRNIVSNALRYTARGRVLVGCRRRNGSVSIEVWDTGVGIAEAHRERVFQEFYQVANPGRDRSQGLGLGLAIVRRLTQLLGHLLQALDIAHRLEEGSDYTLDRLARRLELTQSGEWRILDLSEGLGIGWSGKLRRLELGRQALVALTLFDRDSHYLVRDGKVVIIDENTGRGMPDRNWEQGLHQLIELKEGVAITHPSETLSRLSFQRFFRHYHHLGGMTGTAREVAGELWCSYDLPVTRIPTHRPSRLEDRGAQVMRSIDEKWARVAERVAALHARGQPVLIGTRTVGASEALSRVLTRARLRHQVLNARQDEGEAEIVARAGEVGAITIATNMAGRGTDIKLGRGVEERGGLRVILTELHESGRLDHQLIGRAARQGDRGEFEIIVSLSDQILQNNAPHLARLLAKLPEGGRRTRPALLLMRLQQWRAGRMFAARRSELLLADEQDFDTLAFAGRHA